MSKNNLTKNMNLTNFFYQINQSINLTKNSNVVYSANFGSYDNLTDPKFINHEIDYIYFTDNPKIQSSVWKVILVNKYSSDSRMTARLLKHMPHMFLERYESSLWVDAQLKIDKIPPKKLFLEYKNDFVCFRHWSRKRVYLEAISCIKVGHESPFKILSQYLKYKCNGFKDNEDLIASGVLLRRHMKKSVIAFQETWMDEIYNQSIRDQLSFNYSVYKKGFNHSFFKEDMLEAFTKSEHNYHGVYRNGKMKVPVQRHIYNFLKYFKNKIK